MATVPETVRIVVLGLSGSAVGLSVYLGIENLREGLNGGGRRMLSFAAVRIGYAIVVGLIAEAVFHAPGIPATWRAWLYACGLALTSAGYWGIARDERRRNRRKTDSTETEEPK